MPEARASAQLAPVPEPGPGPDGPPPTSATLSSFQDLVTLAGERRDIKLKTELESNVRPVRFAPGRVEIALQPAAPRGLPNELMRKLEQWTGERWMVSVSDEAGEAPLADQKKARQQSLFREAREMPPVKAVLEAFPGAEILDVRDLTDLPADAADPVDGDEPDSEL
ncbi:MAG: hypothetical protein HKN05_02245 [Rhizobiales bacterium]|nr:hypothetical protein [Hyphomicrobiales bacterium]